MKRYRVIYRTSDGEQYEEVIYAPNKVAAYEEFEALGYDDVISADCYLITRHTVDVRIPQHEIDRINRLLSILSFEEMTDEELEFAGVQKNSHEGVFCAEFDDGSIITFDLCSGDENYYDAVVWTSRNMEKKYVADCEYSLEDMELEINGEYYAVNIIAES